GPPASEAGGHAGVTRFGQRGGRSLRGEGPRSPARGTARLTPAYRPLRPGAGERSSTGRTVQGRRRDGAPPERPALRDRRVSGRSPRGPAAVGPAPLAVRLRRRRGR